MKTIKPGRKQKGWTQQFECTGAGNDGGGCGATLLVSQGDIYSTYSHCRDETDTYNTFTCHNCGVETDIKCTLPFTPPSKATWKKRQSAVREGRDWDPK